MRGLPVPSLHMQQQNMDAVAQRVAEQPGLGSTLSCINSGSREAKDDTLEDRLGVINCGSFFSRDGEAVALLMLLPLNHWLGGILAGLLGV